MLGERGYLPITARAGLGVFTVDGPTWDRIAVMGRLLVLAILTYLTLDFALPAMPGAFEFDLAESSVGAQSRTRDTDDTASYLAALPRAPGFVWTEPSLDQSGWRWGIPAVGDSRRTARRPSLARYDVSLPPEDPH